MIRRKDVMKKQKYDWSVGGQLPKIERHSIAKHEVLQSYLEKYVEVLTGDPRREQLKINLIDGFAGGGEYENAITGDIHRGSPYVMLGAMQVAKVKAQSIRRKPFCLDARYIFVERKQRTCDYLNWSLSRSEFRDQKGSVTVVKGTFENKLPDIFTEIENRGKARRSIFVLDQYGYKDVPMNLLRRIFSPLPNAEVILTFATDWLIDYVGENEVSQKILANVGLESLIGDVVRSKKEQPREWRKVVQNLLHHEIATKSGAKYYTPFFIKSPAAHRSYWLVHLSGHAKARDVMTSLHWTKQNHFVHHGGAGLNMLGFDPGCEYGRQSTFDFCFDNVAEDMTQSALLEQLPSRIGRFDNGIEFQQFFAMTTNETPATSEMLSKALSTLSKDGEVEIRSKHGKLRQAGSIIRPSDVICPPSQTLLFVGRASG